jgi:hypothetical protein
MFADSSPKVNISSVRSAALATVKDEHKMLMLRSFNCHVFFASEPCPETG